MPLAKTDTLDARMLAAFARVLHQHLERERFVKPLADAELQPAAAIPEKPEVSSSERY